VRSEVGRWVPCFEVGWMGGGRDSCRIDGDERVFGVSWYWSFDFRKGLVPEQGVIRMILDALMFVVLGFVSD